MTASTSEGTSASTTATCMTAASDANVQYFLLEEPDSAMTTPQGQAFASGYANGNGATMIMLSEHVSSSTSSLFDHQSTNETDVRRIYLEDDTALPLSDENDDSLRERDDNLQSPLLPLDSSERRGRRRRHRRMSQHRVTELSGLNYLNVATYLVHLTVWWGVAVWGLDALVKTQWEVTQDNATLVTPATWAANYLWVPILLTQAAFTVAQLLPHYRTRSIVTNGTGYYFFYTVLLQIAYTFLYSFGLFIFSFLAALAALVALLSLLASQQRHESGVAASHYAPTRAATMARVVPGSAVLEYLVFQFPFSLHAGWMILMAVDHFSLLVRYYAVQNVGLQLAADIVALALLLPVATFALTQASGPDFVIPVVMLWSYIGIACRLNDPGSAMMLAYGPVVIQAVLMATYCLIGIVSCCMIPFVVICLARAFCTINVIELD